MSAFRLAFLDLVRRPLSTVIAVISIALSIATAGTLLRLGVLAEKRFASMAGGVEAIVGAKSGDLEILLGALNGEFSRARPPAYLPLKLFESLKAAAPVKFEDGAQAQPSFIKIIVPFVYAGTLQDSATEFHAAAVVGTDESLLAIDAGEHRLRLREGAWTQAPGELVLGASLAGAFRLGQVVTVDPLIAAPPGTGPEPNAQTLGQPMPFKVVGILEPTRTAWDRQAWTSLASARVMLSHTRLRNSIWGADVLNYFLIDLEPGGAVKLEALVNDRTVGQVVDVATSRAKLQALTGSGRDVGLVVVILVLAMAVLSLASVLIARFESLSLQLAVLRAIGYSKRELTAWLLCEGLLLGLVACLLGATLDAAAFPAIRSVLGSSLPAADLVASSVFESWPIWCSALVATVLSVAIPIIRAQRQDVHASLRA